MKKNLLTIFLFIFCCISILNSQELNGYKYAYIPKAPYDNGKYDYYNIASIITGKMKAKGFVTIDQFDFDNYSEQYNLSPCEFLTVKTEHTKVTEGYNSVTITFTNCLDEVVYLETGRGIGFTLWDDYRKATNKALANFKYMFYNFNSNDTPELIYPKVESTAETEETLIKYYDNNQLDDIEGIYKYVSETSNNHYKVGIKKYGYKYKGIVVETNNSAWEIGEVKFILEPSAVESVFSCKYYMGNKTNNETFATLENSVLLGIERKNNESSFNFFKLYPQNITSSNNTVNRNVEDWKGNGSGIIISSDGVIITNHHVIDKTKEIEIEFNYEGEVKTYSAEVLKSDVTNDLAILKINDPDYKKIKPIPYNLKSRSAEIGTEVFALGYPMALSVMGKDIKFTDGRISSKTGYMGDITSYQTTTPIQPGNSGGPLFDHKGNLIGINTAGLDKSIADNVSYTVKANYIINLADVLDTPITLPNKNLIYNKPLTEQIKILSEFVVLVKIR